MALARQEEIHEMVINEWLNTFQSMNLTPEFVIAKIRMCKASKRYGSQTTLGDILESETEKYHTSCL